MVAHRQNTSPSWAAIRARMISETEGYINDCLQHPERQIRIPAVKVGTFNFDRKFAQLFWSQLLATS
jgi:hypothetical protein